MPLRVLIAGAGLGGLTLAHGLRSAGLDVHVFERSPMSAEPANSYRIHIDPSGSRALHACLPPGLWATFVEHSAAAPRGIAFVTESLRQLTLIADTVAPDDPIGLSHPISRAGLRRLLLTGLEDALSFEKRLTRYTHTPDGRVTAHFADGSTATGDVLVGADGSTSAVRKQLLPAARVVDTGVTGIAGKLYLTDAARPHVPRGFLEQMTMVLPARGLGMFVAGFQRPPGERSAVNLDLPEHLFWVLIGSADALGLQPAPHHHSTAELRQLALRKVQRWHPFLRWLVGHSDPTTLLSVPLYTSRPVTAWPTSHVTLLGDAIHTMPPLQGLGGNTALRDAAVLSRHLVEAERSRVPLLEALAGYETAMLGYGFEAVRASLQASDGIASTNVPGRLAFRSVLSLADRVPALHRKFFARGVPDRYGLEALP